ncbi:DUF538 domain-containing protein [Cephalotus follicularis]|uniref:DUF538 domain-containing protein n=1 Tax=Cephalotus follicularis TaxID=3775 RepID=A0A1Q3D9U0_CEPFO|nr:DUF538 domain-containing protein [Cephalotus follicularis]
MGGLLTITTTTWITTIFLVIVLPFPSNQTPSSSSSIYSHLARQGLPMGLLPKGITDFSLDPTSGLFQINLTQPCNAEFETQIHYDFNISGVLTYGRIGELSGVTQQELFLWFPVKAIRVDVPSSGLIYFDVGVVDKQFSLSLFDNAPDCTAAALDPHHLPSSIESQNQSGTIANEADEGYILRAVS